MKTIIKRVLTILAVALLTASFYSCEEEDYLEIIAQQPEEDVMFQNTFSDEYILSSEAASNIAERFVWNEPAFDVPTTVNYELEGSINMDFSTEDYTSGTLTDNNHAVTVRQMISLAEMMGLDTDPETTDESGNANNSGVVYFRVRSFVGDAGAVNGVNSVSEEVALTISLVEETPDTGGGIEVASLGVVGSAANDWGGAGPDLPFYTTDQDGILVAYVNLKDGEIKFRENNDWAVNYGDTGADGTLDAGGDNIQVTAGDYKITVDMNALTYTIEPYSWGIVGSAYNDWGGAGPDAKMFYDYTTNTFKVGVKLMEGAMKFRLNNDWANNYGDTGADGTLDNGGDDINVTAGYYMVTLDLANNMYTIEEASLYGVVGSGYNDWGGAGPDFLFTEVSEGMWLAQNVTLIDGEIKFRVNEDWGTNYGDTGADGVLDLDGDNIVVTAGTYDIMLDFSDESAPTYTMILK